MTGRATRSIPVALGVKRRAGQLLLVIAISLATSSCSDCDGEPGRGPEADAPSDAGLEFDGFGRRDMATDVSYEVSDDGGIPDGADTGTGCLPQDACRLDHTCQMNSTDPEQAYCVDGDCSNEPECDVDCECNADVDCPDGEYCDLGACVPNTCTDDCECGWWAYCADGICRGCLATCASDADCAEYDICESYGYEGSCTQCTACPPGADATGATTSVLISTSPEAYVGQEIAVVGTLMTHPERMCDDLGPCGTCTSGLTLDGVIWLRGPDGPAHTLCGEDVGCWEHEDTCLPQWDCFPFEIGRRVRARGMFRQLPNAPDEPWRRLASGYALDVSGIEVVESVGSSGLFEGTLRAESIAGEHCESIPNSMTIQLLVAHSSEGMVVEFMAPSTPGQIPIWPGWHIGQLAPESDDFSVEQGFPGRFSGRQSEGAIEGTYEFSLSGLDCRVTSTVTAEQVY